MQLSDENDNLNCPTKSPFILICDILNSTVDDLSVINVELKELRERSARLEERNQALVRRLREAVRGVAEAEKVDRSTQSDRLSVCDVAVDCIEKVLCVDASISTENESVEVFEEIDFDQSLYNSNLESISMDYSVISPVSTSDMDNTDNLFVNPQSTFDMIEPFFENKDFNPHYPERQQAAIMEVKENISEHSSIEKNDKIFKVGKSNKIKDQKDNSKNNEIVLEPPPINKVDDAEDIGFEDIIKAKSTTRSLNIDDIIVKPLPSVKRKSRSKFVDKVPSCLHEDNVVKPLTDTIKPLQTNSKMNAKSKTADKVTSSSTINENVKLILPDKNVASVERGTSCEVYSKTDMLFYLERYKINFLSFVKNNTNNEEDMSGGCKDLIRSFSNNNGESERKRSKRKRDGHKSEEKLGVIDTGDKCVDENNRDLYDDLDFHEITFSSNASESDIASVGGANRLAVMSDNKAKTYFQKTRRDFKAKRLSTEAWKSGISTLSTIHDTIYPPQTTVEIINVPSNFTENRLKINVDVKNIPENVFSLRKRERYEKKYGAGDDPKDQDILLKVVKHDLSATDSHIFQESDLNMMKHGIKEEEQKNNHSRKEVRKDASRVKEMKEVKHCGSEEERKNVFSRKDVKKYTSRVNKTKEVKHKGKEEEEKNVFSRKDVRKDTSCFNETKEVKHVRREEEQKNVLLLKDVRNDTSRVNERKEIEHCGKEDEEKSVFSREEVREDTCRVNETKELLVLKDIRQNTSVINERREAVPKDITESRSRKRSHNTYDNDKHKKKTKIKRLSKEKDLEEGEII